MVMRLPRLQLFEFNDLDAAPAAVRDTVVESLGRTLAWGHVLREVVGPFRRFLAQCGAEEIVDIGSGSGGPARLLLRELDGQGASLPKFVLTDLHPRVEAWTEAQSEWPSHIAFETSSVDATVMPDRLSRGRARTVINVLHHFSPSLVSAVLEDAVRSGRGIFVVEAFERNPLQFLNIAVVGLPALLANPVLSSKERWKKALLTWATPAALAISVWDGLVSTLRVYSEEELRAMVAPFGKGWRWEYGTFPYFPFGRGYYFYGVPAEGA